jgi:molybdopterin/thiamine biosynthesis adenylyltransferase
VLIVGCGALGTAQLESLARAGIGHLRFVDRDFVEFSNLRGKTMFTEQALKNDCQKLSLPPITFARLTPTFNSSPKSPMSTIQTSND